MKIDMLTMYEQLTKDLNEFELDVVVPIIVKGFRSKVKNGHVGEEYAVKNQDIRKGVDKALASMGHDYKLNDIKCRKAIGAVRKLGLIDRLCSSGKGYFVAKNDDELNRCIESLEQRIRNQQFVLDALKGQMNNKEVA